MTDPLLLVAGILGVAVGLGAGFAITLPVLDRLVYRINCVKAERAKWRDKAVNLAIRISEKANQ